MVDWIKLILEDGYDPEISATSSNCSEQVIVFIGTRMENLAFGIYQLDAQEIVAGGAILAHQPAEPAAQGVSRYSDSSAFAQHGSQTERLRCLVELAGGKARLSSGNAPYRIDSDRPDRRYVYYHASIAQ